MTSSSRYRAFAGLTLLTCLSYWLLMVSGVATASSAGVEHIFTHRTPLTNVSTYTVPGNPTTSGGCSFGAAATPSMSSATLAPHENAVEIREQSVNTQTCTATFEKGTPSAEELVAEGATNNDATASDHSRTVASARVARAGHAMKHRRRVVAHVASTFYGGYVYARVLSELGREIPLASVKVTVEYYSNGEKILSGEQAYTDQWNEAEGWSQVEHNWHHGLSGSETYSSVYAKYKAESGCTLTFNRTAIFGYINGTLDGYGPSPGVCNSFEEYKWFLVRK